MYCQVDKRQPSAKIAGSICCTSCSCDSSSFARSIYRTLLTGLVLTKIAFQYYPLDLDSTSNPFLVSWWPIALGDPALFHVSLQTACLDEQRLAQKGFRTSEILMVDSVTLLRRKVRNQTLAVQDGTMNSVITLAAIEVCSISKPVVLPHD
jgi:branched-subunit amino acid transport protein AzlD